MWLTNVSNRIENFLESKPVLLFSWAVIIGLLIFFNAHWVYLLVAIILAIVTVAED